MFLLACALSLVFLYMASEEGIENKQRIIFLDVGQGDATLIEDSQRRVLVDTGKGVLVAAELAKAIPFGDRYIDIVALTHDDSDHIEGALYVLTQYKVGALMLPELSSSTLMQNIISLAKEKNVPIKTLEQGDILEFGSTTVTVLWPSKKSLPFIKDDNDKSLCLFVVQGNVSALLLGDLSIKHESALMRYSQKIKMTKDISILKAGHHGSKSSTGIDLLQYYNPELVVISSGLNNPFKHPNQEMLNRLTSLGIPMYQTAKCGSLYMYSGQVKGKYADYKCE